MSGQAPVYLINVVQRHKPVRLQPSEFASLLGLYRTNTVTHRMISFSYSSPRLWNRLPEEIKWAASQQASCKVLKTHLFKLSYS